jgi:hypothetical protein
MSSGLWRRIAMRRRALHRLQTIMCECVREIRVAEQPWWRGLAKKGIAEASELQT